LEIVPEERRERALQNLVSTDEDLEGTMKVEPEGRRQLKGRSEGSVAGLEIIRKSLDVGDRLLTSNLKVIVGDH
jgi:hypothetical protein